MPGRSRSTRKKKTKMKHQHFRNTKLQSESQYNVRGLSATAAHLAGSDQAKLLAREYTALNTCNRDSPDALNSDVRSSLTAVVGGWVLDGRLDRRGVNVYVRPTSPYVTGPVGKAVQFNNMTAVSHCWPLIDSTNTDTCSSSSLSNRPSVTATVFNGSVTGTVVTGSITGTVFTGSITGTV